MRVVENKYKSSAATEHCVWIFSYFVEHTTAYEYSRTHILRHFSIHYALNKNQNQTKSYFPMTVIIIVFIREVFRS